MSNHPNFAAATDDRGCSCDNQNFKMCKFPVKPSPATHQHCEDTVLQNCYQLKSTGSLIRQLKIFYFNNAF